MNNTNHSFYLFAITSLLLFLSSCNNNQLPADSFLLTVEIEGLKNGKAQLTKLDLTNNEKIIVDSANIINGKFSFSGKLSSPYVHTVFINGSMTKFHLFLENSKIDVKGVVGDLDHAKITGSREDKLFHSYPIDSIFEKQSGMEIMTQYPDYTFAAFVAYYQFQINNIPVAQMESILNNFSEEVKASIYYEHLEKLFNTIKRVAIAQPAPQFSMPDNNGDTLQLSDFRGKYVLLDFWASWCAPCRVVSPKLVEAYSLFKKRNFTIVGISVDKNKERWLEAIEADGFTWPNLSFLNGWNEVSDLYGIKAIPQNFLIDPKGIIIDKNIEGDVMIEKLDKILPVIE